LRNHEEAACIVYRSAAFLLKSTIAETSGPVRN